jgi:hypothetical protein
MLNLRGAERLTRWNRPPDPADMPGISAMVAMYLRTHQRFLNALLALTGRKRLAGEDDERGQQFVVE